MCIVSWKFFAKKYFIATSTFPNNHLNWMSASLSNLAITANSAPFTIMGSMLLRIALPASAVLRKASTTPTCSAMNL